MEKIVLNEHTTNLMVFVNIDIIHLKLILTYQPQQQDHFDILSATFAQFLIISPMKTIL